MLHAIGRFSFSGEQLLSLSQPHKEGVEGGATPPSELIFPTVKRFFRGPLNSCGQRLEENFTTRTGSGLERGAGAPASLGSSSSSSDGFCCWYGWREGGGKGTVDPEQTRAQDTVSRKRLWGRCVEEPAGRRG